MTDDTISRQAAIKAVEKESQVDGAYGYMDTKSIVDLLNDLPSVQPEQEKGKWLNVEHAPNYLWYCTCSVCGERQIVEIANYCPICGADMRGGQNEL